MIYNFYLKSYSWVSHYTEHILLLAINFSHCSDWVKIFVLTKSAGLFKRLAPWTFGNAVDPQLLCNHCSCVLCLKASTTQLDSITVWGGDSEDPWATFETSWKELWGTWMFFEVDVAFWHKMLPLPKLCFFSHFCAIFGF